MSRASKVFLENKWAFTGADGNEYIITPINLNTMLEIEEKFNLNSIDEIDLGTLGLNKARHLRWFFWVLLKQNHPDMDQEDVGRVIDATNAEEAMKVAMKAFVAGIPETEEGEVEKDKDPSQ